MLKKFLSLMLVFICALSCSIFPGSVFAAESVNAQLFQAECSPFSAISSGGRIRFSMPEYTGAAQVVVSFSFGSLIRFNGADIHYDGEIEINDTDNNVDIFYTARDGGVISAIDLGVCSFGITEGTPPGEYTITISVWGLSAEGETLFQTTDVPMTVRVSPNAITAAGGTTAPGGKFPLTVTTTENQEITRLVIRDTESSIRGFKAGQWTLTEQAAADGKLNLVRNDDGDTVITAGEGELLPVGELVTASCTIGIANAPGVYTCAPQITAYNAAGQPVNFDAKDANVTVTEDPDADGGSIFIVGDLYSVVTFEDYTCPDHEGCLASRSLKRARILRNDTGLFVTDSFRIAPRGGAVSADSEQQKEYAEAADCTPYADNATLLCFTDEEGRYAFYNTNSGRQSEFTAREMWEGAVEFFYDGCVYYPQRDADGIYHLINRVSGTASAESYIAEADTESPADDTTMVIAGREKVLLRMSGRDWYVFSCLDGSVSNTMPYADAYNYAKTGQLPQTETEHKRITTVTEDPGCTTGGSVTRKCDDCGKVISYQILLPIGHDFGDWQTVIEATKNTHGEESRQCSTCGHTENRFFDLSGDIVENPAGSYLLNPNTLSSPLLASMLERMKEEDGGLEGGSITVSIPLNRDSSTSVKLPRSVLEKLDASNVGRVILTSDLVTMSFDAAAIGYITANTTGTVHFTAQPLTSSENPDVAALIRRGSTAYDIVVRDEQNVLNNFGGNCTVSLPMRYTKDTKSALYVVNSATLDTPPTPLSHCIYSENSHTARFIIHSSALYLTEIRDIGYDDIAGHWGENDVLFASARGLFIGTGENQFSPNMTMTRGMFITVLGRLASVNAERYTTTYNDVDPEQYYAGYIGWAQKTGILEPSRSIHPDDPITREDTAVYFARYLKQIGITADITDVEPFADDDKISASAKESILTMRKLGIILGRGQNDFDPDASSTRAEICAMFNRVIKLLF